MKIVVVNLALHSKELIFVPRRKYANLTKHTLKRLIIEYKKIRATLKASLNYST